MKNPNEMWLLVMANSRVTCEFLQAKENAARDTNRGDWTCDWNIPMDKAIEELKNIEKSFKDQFVINNDEIKTKNSYFKECENCTRQYERFCSYFKAKNTCDYKQYLGQDYKPYSEKIAGENKNENT
jgi:hypothetical protein